MKSNVLLKSHSSQLCHQEILTIEIFQLHVVADPQNLGALIRSAYFLGVYLSEVQ